MGSERKVGLRKDRQREAALVKEEKVSSLFDQWENEKEKERKKEREFW